MDRIDKVTKYFNSIASEYDSKYKKLADVRSFIFNERKRIVFEMFELERGKVLDIGCGPAVYTDRLSKPDLDVYGIDSSEEMIEIAKSKNFKNAKFFVGKINNLKFEDNFFDGVLCVGVLEYLDNIEDAIREIARVTKKGGVVIFTVPIRESLLNKLDLFLRNLLKACGSVLNSKELTDSIIDQTYESKLISEKELVTALKKDGFLIEEKRFHIFRLTFLNKLWPRFALMVTKKMNFVSSPLFSANYIVRCRKV